MTQANGTLADLKKLGEVDSNNLILVVDSSNYAGKPGMNPKTKSTFEWKLISIQENFNKMSKIESTALLNKSPVLTGTGPLRRALAYHITGQVLFVSSLKEQDTKKSLLPSLTFNLETIIEWIAGATPQPQEPQPQEIPTQEELYAPFDDTVFQLQTTIQQQQQVIADLENELYARYSSISFIDD
jgi:hypothetical protein